jgi:periplasmic divalent cation tolerance protein
MTESDSRDVLSIATTVASLAQAQQLAKLIIDRRLAACVQIDQGVTSLYRWEGRMCEEPELRLVIKTLPSCRTALESLFSEHHPYDVPQFLAVTMQGSEAYAKWVRESVTPPGTGPSADVQAGG